jgi:hypothetical protein
MAAKWLETLGSIAPTLATAFGGPLAGMAVSIAGKALGLSDASQEQIEQVVVGSKPEDLLKLKQADADLKVALRSLDIKEEELEVKDRESARSIFGQGKIIISVLASVIIGSFLYMVWYMITNEKTIAPENALVVGTLIGYVSSKADQVVAYFFGSSHGSTQKNDVLADVFKKNGNGNGH